MSKARREKTKHQACGSILVEISTVARVSLEDLEIYPEGMDRNEIKAKLVKEFSSMLQDNESFQVGSFQVKILDHTATSRSQPLNKAEEIN